MQYFICLFSLMATYLNNLYCRKFFYKIDSLKIKNKVFKRVDLQRITGLTNVTS